MWVPVGGSRYMFVEAWATKRVVVTTLSSAQVVLIVAGWSECVKVGQHA